jgi:type VI secretion system secreted protein VgrG
VFQDLSVPDIVETIFNEHIAANTAMGSILKLEFDLEKKYPIRSYCLQYRETELAFIERLLFEEGIAYRWQHTSGNSACVTFVAFDTSRNLSQASQGTVRFHRAEATESQDSLTEWTQARRIGSSCSSLTTYDYKPVQFHEANAQCQTDDADEDIEILAECTLEDYDAQTLYYATDGAELHRYATLRQEATDRKKGGYRAAGNMRELMAGEWFQLSEHPVIDRFPEEQRRFTACALEFCANNNLPKELSTRLSSPPTISLASLSREVARRRRDAGPNAANLTPPYWVEISARRHGLPLTPAFAHTDHARPTAPGTQTALVTGPSNEEVFTDTMGRVKIQFHWQRPEDHPEFGANHDEKSSCWLRVAYPSAGAAWGTQYIPRIGQEVIVGFIEDDIDRPLLTGVVHNGIQHNPHFSGAGSLPNNKVLSGVKSKEHFGTQYSELLFDDTPGQVRAKLSSEHGKTQLNQGFLTHAREDGEAEPRGDGFELRTDRHGAIRARDGLLISTEAQPGADGNQLDRQSALSQLGSARTVVIGASDNAKGQEADPTEIGPTLLTIEGQDEKTSLTSHLDHLLNAVKAWEANTNTDPKGNFVSRKQEGRQAVLLLSGQEGLAVTTPEELILSSGGNLDLISQRDTQLTAFRRWIANVGEKISLFVHGDKGKPNLKLITATGHAEFQAQSGDIEIIGDQNVRLTANKDVFTAAAGDELLLTCGGAKISMKGGNIDVHCPGKLCLKFSSRGESGPASEDVKRPGIPPGKLDELERLNLLDFSG